MRQEQLLARLDGPARALVVHAEPGSGKTALAAEWARTRQAAGRPTSWVLIDPEAASPRHFWARVATGLRAVLPEPAGAVLVAVQGGALPVGEATAAIASALVAAPRSLALVIDGLDCAEEAAQAQLVALIGRVPWLRVVVTTRRSTSLETPANRVTLGIDVIDSADLAMTASEILALSDSVGGDLTAAEAEGLRRVTRGSALAVRVALTECRPLSPGAGTPRSRARRISEALSVAAIGALDVFVDEEERQTARRFSLSPELDAPLAAEIAESRGAWELVESFAQRGLGRIEARPRGRSVFTFYALPLAGLRSEAKQHLPLEDRRAVRVRAARRLAALGDPVDVLRLLVEAGLDRSVWGQFVRRLGEITVDRRDEMLDLLYGLSKERIEQDGTLAMVLAMVMGDRALRPSGRTERLIRSGLTELLSRQIPDTATDRFLLEVARFVGHRVLREYPEARLIAQRLLPGTVEFETAAAARAGASSSLLIDFTVVNLLAGDHQGAIDAANLITDEVYPALVHRRNALLALSHTIRGDLQSADRALAPIPDSVMREAEGTLEAAAWRLARVHLLLEQGAVLDAFVELDGLRDRLHECELWPATVWTSAYTRLVTGAAERGAAELERALEGMRRMGLSPSWEERLRAMRADLLLASGAAAKASEAAYGPAKSAPMLCTLARIALVVGRPEDALSRLTVLGERSLRPREAAEVHLLLATAQLRLGRTEIAKHALEMALHRIRETRLRSLLSFITVEDLADLRPLAPAKLWLEPLAQPFSLTALGEALTEREARVLSELVVGDQIAQIAERLHVSPNTVKSQLRSVYRKLGVSGREEAIRAAADHGLL